MGADGTALMAGQSRSRARGMETISVLGCCKGSGNRSMRAGKTWRTMLRGSCVFLRHLLVFTSC